MAEAGRTDTNRNRRGEKLSGLVVALGCVLFLGGFIWAAILYQPYTVPTNSMEPTVQAGDRVLAERIDGDAVRRGDVVVFHDSGWGSEPMIKRVVGIGGDKVACCDRQGRLHVNGEPIQEEYLGTEGGSTQRTFSETAVPSGKLFLLGDNRRESLDSRTHLQDGGHGAVARSAVQGRVDAVAWPTGNLGMLPKPTDAGFGGLPGGVSEPGPLQAAVAATLTGAVLILGGAAYGPLARRAAHSTRSS